MDGAAVFKDTVTVDSLGGSFDLQARIENETMNGTLKKAGDSKAAPVTFTLKRVFLQPPTLGMAPPEELSSFSMARTQPNGNAGPMAGA